MEDNMDMEPLLKSYIRYAMGFVPKERMAYATNNGEYDRIKIMVNSKGNIIEPSTYAITFELYNGDQRIIIGSLWLSGRCIYIIETVVNVVLYKRRIQEMMEFEEFCNANNNIPKGILKIPTDFKV
jgi:hypothetical protein